LDKAAQMQHFFSKYIVMGIWVTLTMVNASSIDALIDDFSKKNALSQSTIDKNKGHLILYTRDKLERMHAKTLKDVLKTIPVLQYNENRYGVADPLTQGGISPYSSNLIRIYIDNVEVTQGWMGSGLIQYGDINIDFADHIEMYAIPPSFDTSSESAYMTIFIYSKVPERDRGGQLSLIQASRGSNTQTIGYGDKESDVSYMVNLSHTKENREKVNNGTETPLSRDFKRTQIFSYIKNKNQMFHFQLIHKQVDTLAGLSMDATPLVSQMDNMSIHIDYAIQFSEYWKAQFAYDYLDTELKQEDDIPLLIAGKLFDKTLNTRTKNTTYSADLTYKNIISDHHIAFGLKGRVKKLDSLYVQNLGFIPSDFDEETILSVFIQDQYALSKNELITLGLKYSNVSRNKTFENDDLFQVRLGYLYNNDTWSYKAYIFENMFTVDPFARYFALNTSQKFEPQVCTGITQELAYKGEGQDIRLMTIFVQENNNLIDINNISDTTSFISLINYDYTLDRQNDINIQFAHSYTKDIKNIEDVNTYTGYIMLSSLYDSFSIYNGLVWNYDTYVEKNYYDWTSSISLDISDNLTFTLQGQNLLNKAREYQIFRINPLNGSLLSPLKTSAFDQRISAELEYAF